MQRRDALLVLTTTMVGMGGCAGAREPEVGLGQITIQNRRENPVEINVFANRAEESVFEEGFTLDGRDDYTIDELTITEDWMGDSVEYMVAVDLTDEDLGQSYSTEEAEEFVDDWGPHECFGCRFVIEDQIIHHLLNPLKSCPSET